MAHKRIGSHGRRGRPRKAHARRRETTRAGRAGLPGDVGTAELRARRLRATTRSDLPHDDPLAVLYGRGFLSREQYAAGREIAGLLERALRSTAQTSSWRLVLEGFTRGRGWTPLGIGDEGAGLLIEGLRRRLDSHIVAVLFPLCAGFVLSVVGAVLHGRHLSHAETLTLQLVRLGLDEVGRLWAADVGATILGVEQRVSA